ncbi:C25 family cysteine peptidase [Foetidibacter luteolus]|uniref:putative type IX secretion system sortase PorU2 n=1 Tax=Foetidibacter luteolus TaxID=2608880 RepID=UPI00129A4F15|nr:C25 family cysteine peptidase [Foetidibacter luteolus]
MPRRLLAVLLLALCYCSAYSQSYRNEWIDFNKTYYKFKIGPFGFDIVNAPVKKGVVRISQASLTSAGIGYIPFEQLQLWHNGEEVMLYTSKPAGVPGAGDYIEFWGEINDGKIDRDLYRQPDYQLSDYWSMQTDTAAYFFTVNTSGNNKRYTNAANNAATASIQPEANFMYKIGRYYRFDINPGLAAVASTNLYSSSYDRGEMWVSRPTRPVACGCGQGPIPQSFLDLHADANGAAMTLKINAVGAALNPRKVKVSINGDEVSQFTMNYFNTSSPEIKNIAVSKIQNDQATVVIENLSGGTSDLMNVATVELTYPRLFDFGGASSFEFSLPASDTGRLISVSNFSNTSGLPVLLDMANGKRYVAVAGSGSTWRFLLNASSVDYKLVMVRSDGSAAQAATGFETRKFVNYQKASSQGDYLIISNPILYGTGSDNYVEQYRAYRSSDAGGGFNAKLIDVNELTDQFAYGIKKHPLAIKNFLRYARKNFSEAPRMVFLLGKGVDYASYRKNESNAVADKTNLVPTWGYPGSDNLMCSEDMNPVVATPVGRLSAATPAEVGNYLKKIMEYEASQSSGPNTIDEKAWMRNVLHLTGASDAVLGSTLDAYNDNYKKIISDTLFGGVVTSFSKTADPASYPKAIINFKSVYEQGASLVEYFGHSSQTSLDFSLSNPNEYNNKGKYPLFIVNGCLAGNIFGFEQERLNIRSTTSEKFVFEPARGAIGYIATTSFGAVPYLDAFTKNYYTAIAKTKYGKPVSEISQEAISQTLSQLGIFDFFARIHAEQYEFHGDPALKMNSFDLPDYAIDSSRIQIAKSISVADEVLPVKVSVYNLGRISADSVTLNFYRKFPSGDSVFIFSKKMRPVASSASIEVKLPIIANRDKGIGFITVFIDEENKLAEVTENNNVATASFKIIGSDVKPVYPYNYSIVTGNSVQLIGSTADALEKEQDYIIEMDTTALFNSPFKQTIYKTTAGGLVEAGTVALTLNNTVYYWRIAANDSEPNWNVSSFTHIQGGNKGFMQAHFYQHTKSILDGLLLDSASRKYSFAHTLSNVFVQQSIYPYSGTEEFHFSTQVNGTVIAASACIGNSMIFHVLDSLSLKPMPNPSQAFNSAWVCSPLRLNNFEFYSTYPEARKNAMDFLDAVPNGSYVIAKRIYDAGNADWAPTDWASDTALYGAGNSLYHRFKQQGVNLDPYTYPRTFVAVYKKNDGNRFAPVVQFSEGLYDRVNLSVNIPASDTIGYITSPLFGPGKAFSKFKWDGPALDGVDSIAYEITGVKANGETNVLYTVDGDTREFDISSIDASAYPYLKLRMKNADGVKATPYQLEKWSVEYQPYPEGAIAPNLAFDIPSLIHYNHGINKMKDTLKGVVAFKNISDANFTSQLKVKLVLYDSLGNAIEYVVKPTRVLAAGDTALISFAIDISALEGVYNLYLHVNPDKAEAEQYYFNNYLYQYVKIERDYTLPVKLASFKAVPAGKNVQVKWEVTDEKNLDHYEVLFSSNGRSFSAIGTVNAEHNNVAGKYAYSLLHTSPVSGKNYYRLKMVDKDGMTTYSNIEIVSLGQVTATMAYPNPFSQYLNVSVARQDNGRSVVRLFNVQGQMLRQQTFVNNVSLNVANLASGTYIVQVDDGNEIKTFKVQKHHY